MVDWPQRQPRRDPHPLTSQCRGRAIQDVRRKHHIGYRIGERWRYRQAQYQCDTPQRRLPKRVGSEACATRQGHHYATIVVNLRLHQVFDVLDQRRTATVSTFLAARSDRRRLQVAAIDRRRACRDAVQEQGPWAVIVMDRFHGIKSATTAFHTVRKRVARHPAETDRRRLTGRRNLLGKAPEDLSPAKRLELYGVLADFPPLRLAHSLVHGLRRWYNLPDVQMARARLRAWLYRIKKAERNELGELAATMRRWQQGIVNCFRDRVTKGGTEGINTKIKRLKRVAYGLPNFAHIRARILLAFSPEVRSPP